MANKIKRWGISLKLKMASEDLVTVAVSLVFMIIIASMLLISFIYSDDWEQEAKDIRINCGNGLDAKASAYCPIYDMEVLRGVYLRDIHDIPENSICVKEKADGGLEYYYLTDSGVPIPLANTGRLPY